MNMSSADCGFELHGRQELVEVAPYLLGYHPTDSVVAVGMSGQGGIELAIRADLSDAANPALAEQLVTMAKEAGAERLVLLVYAGPQEPPPAMWEAEVGLLPHDELVEELAGLAVSAGMRMVGALYVSADRWWTYQPCGDPDCCPPDGGPAISGDCRPAAEATYAGMTALPDRSALVATLDPVGDPFGRTMETALAAARQELLDAARSRDLDRWQAGVLIHLRSVLDRVEGGDVPWLSDRVAARLVLGLTDVFVRDRAWLWLEADPAARWTVAEPLWRQLARRAPEQYRAAPLFLGAWACWRGGDGVRARIGVERALSCDPGYQAALLMEEALNQGMDPRGLEPLLPSPPPARVRGGPEIRRRPAHGQRRARARTASGGPG